MNVLLDTHTLLWTVSGDKNISRKALAIVDDAKNNRFVSIASLWEIVIKQSIGKLKAADNLEILLTRLTENKVELLDIKSLHLITLQTLPMHHRDPFDRILISQAITERLTIVTKDNHFAAYDVKTTW